MSALVAIALRLFGLFGIKLSPFIGGAIVAGLVAAGAGLVGLHIYNSGWNNADALWRAKALQSRIATLEADRDNAQKALGDARLRLAAIEAQSNADKEGTANYVKTLEAHFSAACALDDADIDFLRKGIAGPGRARPGSAGSTRRSVLPDAGAGVRQGAKP